MKKLLFGLAMAALATRVVTKWRRGHERDRWLAARGELPPDAAAGDATARDATAAHDEQLPRTNAGGAYADGEEKPPSGTRTAALQPSTAPPAPRGSEEPATPAPAPDDFSRRA